MEYGSVPGVDKPISRLVQGTMPLSGKDLEASFALLDGVLEAGCTAFDTAHIYGGGGCERVLGRWLSERGVRERIVILAKGAHHNQDRPRVTPFDIAADLHDSLARLKTDYVDLYLLHRDDPSVPVGPIVEALNEHKAAGCIRAFGGSNWTHDRIRAACEYAEAHGLTGFAASSPNFSLAVRVKEVWAGCVSISGRAGQAAREFYRQRGMPVFAWSSLAGGFFSGRLTRENKAEHTDYFDRIAVDANDCEENWQRLDRVRELAAARGATPAQIALAWVMTEPLNLFALVGCRTASEFQDNAAALSLSLTAREREYLDLRADSPA